MNSSILPFSDSTKQFITEALTSGHTKHPDKHKGYTIFVATYPSDYPSFAINLDTKNDKFIELGNFDYDDIVEELDEYLDYD